MANVLLAGPNYVDATYYPVVLSGGDWNPALPLDNLKNPELAVVARSVDADPSSTWFDIDLGTQRLGKAFVVPFINGTRDAQYRIRSSNTAGSFAAPESDSGTLDLYPIIYPFGTVPYGSPSWWDGKMSPEEASVTRMPIIQVFGTPEPIARYWRLEIFDEGNPDGYVEMPRLMITAGWQGSDNADRGSEIGVEPLTSSTKSMSGAEVFDRRDPQRTAKVTWTYLPEDEAFASAFDLMKIAGTDQQIFFAWDPDDTAHRHRRSFLATLSRLGTVQASEYGRFAASFLVKEVMP